ncbi:MAG: tetratricopeptide repeat protein [Roseburia sp.]
MRCYNCDAQLDQGELCPNCGADVRIYKKIMMASNAYYNDGLARAGVRDLSGAVDSLKRSLRFNKMNIDARNLLGLIYFEMGEVVDALTEWVISKNYQPRDNVASRYLDEIQNNQARLDTINQTIKKYNQALLYCRQESRDLAIIQLKKVISLNPKMVKGHQLLALLYIQDGKYDLAKKELRCAGKIDANNTITLRYLKEANIGLREAKPNRKNKNDDLISYQSGNDTIIQPAHFKDTSVAGTIINIIIGIVVGVAITGFLIVPGMRHNIQNEAKQEVKEANDTISTKNQTISSLEAQIESMTQDAEDAQTNEESMESKISSYEQLLIAYSKFVETDMEAAGNALANVNAEYLDENSKAIYDTMNEQVNAEYVETLYQEAYEAYSSQNYTDAADDFQKIADIDETYQDGNTIYYLAQSYRKLEDTENAKIYYQKVVDLYPGTERATTAQNYLDEYETE